MSAPAPDQPARGRADAALRRRGDRIVFRARRPAMLVLPFAVATEAVGILFLVNGTPIWWAVCAAPVVALLVTALLFRPTLELCREGLLQRQYPFSSLNRWEAIAGFGITRAGNRVILGYRLHEGARRPRRQPAATLLRAAGRPFDGGYFADSLAAPPERVLEVVQRYLGDAALRETLPAARR